MDTVIKRKSKKLRIATIVTAVFLVFSTLAYFSFSRKRSLRVKQSEILVKEVVLGPFEDFTTFEARVEPLNAQLVNIVEGGSVQQIFVENGSRVEKGQALAKMYNPNSELNYMTQETAIIEQMNNLNSGKLNIRNQELGLTQDLAKIEHDYNDAKRLYDMNQRLFEKGVISKNDWNAIQENFRYQSERRDQIRESIRSEKHSNRIQIAQIDRSIATMEKSLEILRDNKKNFLVTAPQSGILTSFEPILGKTYQAGESIGKIDVQQGYKLVADVDEFYLPKISVGQKGSIDYQGTSAEVRVFKVLPEVKAGKFHIELGLPEKAGVKQQQGVSFGVRLRLSGQQKRTLLPKGQFYQESAGKWVFVLNGSKAERRAVKLGRENPDYYEVLSGLHPAEKVVTSSYVDYKDIEILLLE